MPLLETLTIEVGASISKAILKLWLKDAGIAADVSSTVLDVLKARTTDILAQQRGKRQFEEIGQQVAESLLPVFESEGAALDDGSREAVARAVAETIGQAGISAELLAEKNLEAATLARHLLDADPEATRLFLRA